MEERTDPQPGHSTTAAVDEDPALRTDGFIVVPMAAAAALDSSVFSKVNASEAVPATWEERAPKAWEYYLEEPLVKNCINSWRTFAVIVSNPSVRWPYLREKWQVFGPLKGPVFCDCICNNRGLSLLQCLFAEWMIWGAKYKRPNRKIGPLFLERLFCHSGVYVLQRAYRNQIQVGKWRKLYKPKTPLLVCSMMPWSLSE